MEIFYPVLFILLFAVVAYIIVCINDIQDVLTQIDEELDVLFGEDECDDCCECQSEENWMAGLLREKEEKSLRSIKPEKKAKSPKNTLTKKSK